VLPTPTVLISFAIVKDRFPFPAPGQIRSLQFPNVSAAVIADLDATIEVGKESLGFKYLGLGGDDSILFTSLDSSRFFGNVVHGLSRFGPRFAPLAPCIARCADGRSAPGCVECAAGAITAKICC
jgi:hypothetical protein